jgi:hypothetical protein
VLGCQPVAGIRGAGASSNLTGAALGMIGAQIGMGGSGVKLHVGVTYSQTLSKWDWLGVGNFGIIRHRSGHHQGCQWVSRGLRNGNAGGHGCIASFLMGGMVGTAVCTKVET